MVLEIVIFILDMVLLFSYAAALIFGISLAKKLYGGKFSSLILPLVGGIGLLFVMAIFGVFINLFTVPELTTLFLIRHSLPILQLMAGLLFLNVAYQFYVMHYATSGFLEEKYGK